MAIFSNNNNKKKNNNKNGRSERIPMLGRTNRRQHKAHYCPVQRAGQHADKRYHQGGLVLGLKKDPY